MIHIFIAYIHPLNHYLTNSANYNIIRRQHGTQDIQLLDPI